MPDRGSLSGRLAWGTAAAFFVYGGGAGVSYVAQLAVARIVGPADYGVYAYVLAWATVLAYFCALGFDVSLLRFVSAYRARQSWGLMLGVTRFADRVVAATGVGVALVGVALVLTFGLVPGRFARTFVSGFALVPALALLWVRCSTSRALGGVVIALAPDRLVRDGLLLVLVVALGPVLGWRLDAACVMDATVLAGVVGLGLASLARRHLSQRFFDVTPQFDARTWMRAAGPLVVLGAVEAMMNRTGVVLLGWTGAVTEAGIYAVVFNVAFLAILPRTAANTLFAPAISELFVSDDRTALQALMTRTAVWAFLGATAIALPLLVLTGPILSWFGHDFAAGVMAARILLVGQIAASAAGCPLFIMTMTGRERAAAAILTASAAGNVLLGLGLIRVLGLEGAAVAASINMIVWNLAMAMFVRRKLGLRSDVFAVLAPSRTEPKVPRCSVL
ncbi:MAG: oligosaccharide flippase family protein [Alphaproteobacteria bacterium]|nr:oligosaccharide flippase family protein [Alphaproteobacteria bacterium]